MMVLGAAPKRYTAIPANEVRGESRAGVDTRFVLQRATARSIR
jgi:hypothetical protein